MARSVSVQCVGLITLIAILVQTIAVALTFVYFNKVLNTMQDSFSRSSVSCLINSDVEQWGSQGGGSQGGGAPDRKTDPCWQVTQQLHYHVQKKMADRFQREMSITVRNKLTGVLPVLSPGIRGVSLPKVAAHVTGVVSSSSSSSSSSSQPPSTDGSRTMRSHLGERVRSWEGHRGPSFLQNMELRGGELVTATAGLYYIYAQTYFRLPPTGDTEQEEAQLVQYVYKKMSSYTVPILLMKSSRSVCWPPGPEPGLFSLHQAGTAFLQHADRLFITVSNATDMEMDGKASYFGAVLIG